MDDPAAPSGGNTYDRRVCDGLLATRDVYEIRVPGAWPDPAPSARQALGSALAGLPPGAVVLLDGLVAGAVPELLSANRDRLRLVVLIHLPLGDETGLAPDRARALTGSERRAVHAAHAVIATSTAAARRVAALHELPAERVHVAAPGTDPAPVASPSRGGGRLLCVAAVTPRKGQDVLVEALSRCADLGWTCRFVGALDRAPEYASAVIEAAALLNSRAASPAPPVTGTPDLSVVRRGKQSKATPPDGSNGRTAFVGPLAGDDLAAAYADADLMVLPSRAETYGMVVTEALARAVPVLATDVAGVREALGAAPGGAKPGVLQPPGDPDALAAAIRRWLTDSGWRDELRAAAGARRLTLRGWDDTVARVDAVLDDVARRDKSGQADCFAAPGDHRERR